MSAVNNWSSVISFIWSVKEILRDHYRRHEYGEVVLPMVVLRRLDAALAEPSKQDPSVTIKQAVLDRAAAFEPPYDAHYDLLCRVAGLEFYNTSKFDFSSLLGDEHAVVENFNDYLNGYSPNVREVIQAFDFWNHVERLGRAGILFQVLGKFADPAVDLSPSHVSNMDMGYIYEELIRTVADLTNEEAGEHFTPREVIELMVSLLVADDPDLHQPGRIVTVYDPACGTGGMLTESKEKLLSINPSLKVHMRGQEVQPESFAICKSDMLIKGERTAQIRDGDTLGNDRFPDERFNYVIANPPYGKDWKTVEKAVKKEHAQLGMAGRFGPGLPPTSDGQMLFLLHMVSKLKRPEEGGGRLAVVMNGSPLFSGDAGSGPSEIRRYLIEQDLVEAIIGLPTELFYNTGINTYIWILTTKKSAEREGYVQLIDARDLYSKMPRSLGNKRNLIGDADRATIVALFDTFVEGDRSKIFPNEHFGYRKVTIDQPRRVLYRVEESIVDAALADRTVRAVDELDRADLAKRLSDHIGWSGQRQAAELLVEECLRGISTSKAARASIVACMAVPDDAGELVVGKGGGPEPDVTLRDTENIPLDEDVGAYLRREILPFFPDAWPDRSKDRIGYEIPFTKVFYTYRQPRSLAEIDSDLKASQTKILELLAEVAD